VDADHLAAGPSRHALHASPEVPVGGHKHYVAWLDQIGERRLHRCRARPADRDGPPVRGPEGVPEERLYFLHDPDEGRIEMTDERRAHGAENARMNVARTGSHQDAIRWVQGADVGSCILVSHVSFAR
jgi:hypothetical protein